MYYVLGIKQSKVNDIMRSRRYGYILGLNDFFGELTNVIPDTHILETCDVGMSFNRVSIHVQCALFLYNYVSWVADDVCREHRRVWLLAVSSLYWWRRLQSWPMCLSKWIHSNSVRDQVCQTWRYATYAITAWQCTIHHMKL